MKAFILGKKTTNFYSKKGLSWHGTIVYSGYTAATCKDNENLLKYHINYYDYISSGDSKQDYITVAAYFDTLFRRMLIDLPHVKKLYLQSDNACYYKKR